MSDERDKRPARVTIQYRLPMTAAGVVQGQTIWCPACGSPVAMRLALDRSTPLTAGGSTPLTAGGLRLEMTYYCLNNNCPNHRRAGGVIRARVDVDE